MIVFDAGGTLIGADWSRVTHDLAAAAADQGLLVRPAELMTSMRRVWQEVIAGQIVDRAHIRQAVTQFWNSLMARALTLAAATTPSPDGPVDPRACQVARAFYPRFDTGTYHHLIDGARETLRLLADRMVELEIVDSISHEAVRQALKKTTSNPG